MDIPSFEIRVRSAFGPLKARVTAEAIKALRHSGSKSLPAYVIAEYRDVIEAVIVRKYEAGTLDDKGFVVVTEEDVTR